jgi:hypothetical protein
LLSRTGVIETNSTPRAAAMGADPCVGGRFHPSAISLLPIVRATAYDVGGCKLAISPENIKNAPHHLHRRHNCRKRASQCAGLEGIRISERGPTLPAIDVKSLHAKIGELTLENDS